MPRTLARRLSWAGLLSILVMAPAGAIEMFTYFGDGSSIGLPRLEVPVQAYPGIPLRSDRIRARSRAQQARKAMPPATRGGTVQPPVGSAVPGIPGGGITIRPMPRQDLPSVPPQPAPALRRPVDRPTTQAPPSAGGYPPPEPIAPPPESPLPGFSKPVFPARP